MSRQSGKDLKKLFIFFFSYCPLQILAIMIFCNQDISKTVTALSCKLGQIIEDNE